jgi:transcriptional regulator with XRE-family HTH domain
MTWCDALDMSIQTEGYTAADLAPDLADRMRKSLRVSGVPVQAMADYLEVDRNTVGRWINGHVRPSGAMIKLWALRVGVPVSWLRDGVTPMSDDAPDGGECPEQDSNLQPTVLRPSVPAWQGSAA